MTLLDRSWRGLWPAALLLAASGPSLAAPALMPVPIGNRTGYADAQGRLVVPPTYLEADEFIGDEPLARVMQPKAARIGYIDATGREVVAPAEGHAVIGRCAGVVVRQPTGNGAAPQFFGPDGAALPTPALPPQATLSGLSQGRTACWMTLQFDGATRQRPMRLDGTWLGDGLSFDSALEFSCVGTDGPCLAPAVRGGRWGHVDESGRWAIPARFANVQAFSADGFARAQGTDGAMRLIDTAGRERFNAAALQPPAVELPADMAQGLLRARADSGWGFVDADGRWAVAPQLAAAADMAANGLAAARDASGRWGYVRREGGWAIAPAFAQAGHFSALALAAVVDGEGCHRLINAQGQPLASFDQAARAWQPETCRNGALRLSWWSRGGWQVVAGTVAGLLVAGVIGGLAWRRVVRRADRGPAGLADLPDLPDVSELPGASKLPRPSRLPDLPDLSKKD